MGGGAGDGACHPVRRMPRSRTAITARAYVSRRKVSRIREQVPIMKGGEIFDGAAAERTAAAVPATPAFAGHPDHQPALRAPT